MLLLLSGLAHAAWFDNTWPFRRPIDVDWPADRPAVADELAWTDFTTAGHHRPDGSDIRVATDEGKLVAARVLSVGPGDRVHIVFALARNVRKYFVYFGNPDPPAPPKGLEDVTYRWGLLMESRRLVPGPVQNAQQLADLFGKANAVIGRRMVDRLFLGLNPFGEACPHVTRLTGTIFAPSDGTYTFSVSALQRGALFINGKPLVYAPFGPGDTRFHASIDLKRGKHDLRFYHAVLEGDGRYTVVWKRPDQNKYELIPPENFGAPFKTTAGPLEEHRKTLTADFQVEYMGETFYSYHYSHRFRFGGHAPKAGGPAVKFEWNFGDGQTATGGTVDHVFLADGDYPVALTIRLGGNSDTQTTKVHVSRQFGLERPALDPFTAQSKLVQTYDLEKMPPIYLPWATILHLRAEAIDPAVATGMRLATIKTGLEGHFISEALRELTRELLVRQKAPTAIKLWETVPPESPIYPRASRQLAHLLLWRTAEFTRAVKILESLVKTRTDDNHLKRLYAHALILDQRAAEGRKILEQLPAQGAPDRQAALSGAMARTLEFYLHDGDWETAEETWDKWQAQYPGEFLEGYGMMLKVRLMELYKAPDAAAKVAEAFALAVPNSSYSPQLLDKASKLLATSNPAKSQSLRQLLKQKYPEDPLAQDQPPATAPSGRP